jgi:hypothetical protein
MAIQAPDDVPTLPNLHAGRRCGMGVRLMRKGVRMPKSSQTGIWRRNRP